MGDEEAGVVGFELSCRTSRKQRGVKELGLWEGTTCAIMTWKHDECDKALAQGNHTDEPCS